MSARGLAIVLLVLAASAARAHQSGAGQPAEHRSAALEAAQHHFYSSRYAVAADQALQLINTTPTDLAAFELRTSALHFQIRRAKARLAEAPTDEQAMYYLSKINFSYVWLQLSTLGKRTGWDEYWEARRHVETVLKNNPSHLRARVAQAWMEYIVGSRVPWGTRWLMGGGNKDRGVRAMRNAAAASGDFYSEVEADFALWEMLVREGKRAEALPMAKDLLTKFPDNEDLAKFLGGS
jgi:tetratricopeptide (TPR) repeat protein